MTDDPTGCTPGTSLGDRYRLEALVSRGSFTEMWRAKDEVLGRTVAAKILLPEHVANTAVKRLFRVEALAAARLTHSNIVAVFDTGEHRGAPFVVMEFLPGGNLRELIDRGPVPWERIPQLGTEICAALAHAHSSGLVHRDIRPENVLFTESGHLKVSDFGIAGAEMAARPSTDARLARDAYASPEQSIDLEPDARADIYSVGAVLYECATGKTPAEAMESPGEGASGSLRHIPAPSKMRPDVPTALDQVVLRALAVDPAERFPSARAFGQELQKLSPASQTEPAVAAPRPSGPRITPQTPPTVQSRTATPKGGSDPSVRTAASPPTRRAQPAPDPSTESFLRSEGRWLLPTLLVMVAAAAIVLAIPSVRDRLEDFVPITGNGAEPVEVVSTGAYDPPPGDGEENSDSVRLAFDGDDATSWSTSSYATADFGNLKPGVGIYFDLGEAAELEEIRVSSVAGGWQASVRHSDDGRTWSEPGEPETVQAEHSFPTQGSHRYWMIWVTRLVRTPGEGTGEHPFAVAIQHIDPQGAA